MYPFKATDDLKTYLLKEYLFDHFKLLEKITSKYLYAKNPSSNKVIPVLRFETSWDLINYI